MYSVWLKDAESGTKAFVLDRSNIMFMFSPEVGNTITSLLVEGSPIPSSALPVSHHLGSSPLLNIPGSSGINPPPPRFSQQKKRWKVQCKNYTGRN